MLKREAVCSDSSLENNQNIALHKRLKMIIINCKNLLENLKTVL